MSSNTTQRRVQPTILASDVEAFRTWFMVADCGQCGPRARRIRTIDRQRGEGTLEAGGQYLAAGKLRLGTFSAAPKDAGVRRLRGYLGVIPAASNIRYRA